MNHFIDRLIVWGIIFSGILFLIEFHTEAISSAYNKVFSKTNNAPKQKYPFTMAEESPEKLTARFEKMAKNKDYKIIIKETDKRKDLISRAYRALAIMESGEFPHLFAEGITNMNKVIRAPTLPNDLHRRLILTLGDPEEPGPSPRENLEAYKEIVKDLGIATQPETLKKLHKLEQLAQEEEKLHSN